MQTIDMLRKSSKKFEASLERAREKMKPAGGGLEALELGSRTDLDDVSEAMLRGDMNELPQGSSEMANGLEAIILGDLRPAYRFKDDQIIIEGDFDHIDLIQGNKTKLENICKNVGRIDLLNHATMEYVGTGWLVRSDIVVTNRHVANAFAHPSWSKGWDFADGAFGRPLRVETDFVRQSQTREDIRRFATVTDILYIAPRKGPDMAFLRIDRNNDLEPIEPMAGPIKAEHPVATIGYPEWDGKRNDSGLMDDIFGGVYGVKRFSPGMINGTDENGVIIYGDYTSLGGNSGSAVLDLETGKAVGLHFAGVFKETNYALAIDIVEAGLRNISNPQIPVGPPDLPPTEAVEFSGRMGYDPDFLGINDLCVPLPDLGCRSSDLAPVQGNSKNILNYIHFSVLQSKSRRLPMLTAVNIDGEKAFRLKRKGSWRLDGRISRDHQMGNELYRHNPLDRGHMVRRMDPGWGDTQDEAQQAEIDTFHYTNSAPQHKDLNQKDWVGLEDYILEAADTKGFKVSVMTGPVFLENDRRLKSQPGAEDVQIPESFWKVAVLVNKSSGDLSATGYLLTQGEMIRDLTEAAFILGEYKTYQVSIKRIEELTGFDWRGLRENDPLKDSTESVFGESVIPVYGPESLVL